MKNITFGQTVSLSSLPSFLTLTFIIPNIVGTLPPLHIDLYFALFGVGFD